MIDGGYSRFSKRVETIIERADDTLEFTFDRKRISMKQ